MRAAISAAVVLTLCGLGSVATADSSNTDEDLALGVRQYEQAEYLGAIVTLDAFVQAHKGDRSRAKELADAYLHLGMSHLALNQESAARMRFRAAIEYMLVDARARGQARTAADLMLDAALFSPKVIDAFEAAKREMIDAEQRAAGATPAGPTAGAGKTRSTRARVTASTLSARPIVCRIEAYDRQAGVMTLRNDTLGLVQVPVGKVERLEISGGKQSRWKLAWKTGLVGLVLGAVIGGSDPKGYLGDQNASTATGALAGGAGFALFGGGIGALMNPGERWEPADPATVLPVNAGLGHAPQIRVSLRF
jgi:hypothetical protein